MTMINPGAQLRPRCRAAVPYDASLLERAAKMADGPELARLLYLAELSGDRHAVYKGAVTWLRAPAAGHLGRARWRLVYGAALAAVPQDPATVRDLEAYASHVRDGFALVQINVLELGFRKEGDLDRALDKARRAVEALTGECVAVARGKGRPWELVRLLSIGGDLVLADAVARSSWGTCGVPYAAVRFAATFRHLHGDPQRAVELHNEVLAVGERPAALNGKAGALGDMGEYPAAFDTALRSIALKPDGYSGRTLRRAARNVGRFNISAMGDRLAERADAGASVRERDHQAAVILGLAGPAYRHVAEWPLARMLTADPSAMALRNSLDRLVIAGDAQ
jgi:hypothetical protein